MHGHLMPCNVTESFASPSADDAIALAPGRLADVHASQATAVAAILKCAPAWNLCRCHARPEGARMARTCPITIYTCYQ